MSTTNSTNLTETTSGVPAPLVTPLPPSPVPAPTPRSGGGLASGFQFLGGLRVPGIPSVLSSSRKAKTSSSNSMAPQKEPTSATTEIVDFTYVNVCETDADAVDITLDGQHTAMKSLQGRIGGEQAYDENQPPGGWMRGDILSILLSGAAQQEDSDNEILVVRRLR